MKRMMGEMRVRKGRGGVIAMYLSAPTLSRNPRKMKGVVTKRERILNPMKRKGVVTTREREERRAKRGS